MCCGILPPISFTKLKEIISTPVEPIAAVCVCLSYQCLQTSSCSTAGFQLAGVCSDSMVFLSNYIQVQKEAE